MGCEDCPFFKEALEASVLSNWSYLCICDSMYDGNSSPPKCDIAQRVSIVAEIHAQDRLSLMRRLERGGIIGALTRAYLNLSGQMPVVTIDYQGLIVTKTLNSTLLRSHS